MGNSVPVQYFVELYRRERDPWSFETSDYERAKYEATLDALPKACYSNALELACSIGIFTSMLAPRTDTLLALDVSPEALRRARRNCAQHPHVRFELRTMPHEYPEGRFDLTTVCEVGYYLGRNDLALLCNKVVTHSVPGAHVVLVHWTPPVKGHASTAEEVHDAFRSTPELRWLHGFSEPTYRLDVLEKLPHA